MDGYMELFLRTGSPVFYTAARAENAAEAADGEQTSECRKNLLQGE